MESISTLSRRTAPEPPPSRRGNIARLAFEGFLLLLCGYLIGVHGFPPFFGPQGQSAIASEATDSIESDAGAETAVDVDGDATEAPAAATDVVVSRPGEGTSVTIGRASWSTGYFQAAVFKALLEELGYQVSEPAANEHVPADAYRLMANGEFDFWANSWYPNHQPDLEADGAAGLVSPIGNLLPNAGLEGLVITASVAEEQQITSLAQINDDPELVALFDSDGNGRAEIGGCPKGWGCHGILNETLTFNGWDNLEQVSTDAGSFPAFVAETAARVEQGEPAVLYTWSPSGYLTALRPGDNVMWLDMGGQDRVLDGSITPERNFAALQPPSLAGACTADPCWLGWPAASIQVTARNDFLDANPAARSLFEQVQLRVLDVARANVKYDTGEDTEEDLDRHAREWIAENRAQVDNWLNAARAAT